MLSVFARAHLGGIFIRLFAQEAHDEVHVLYLPKEMAILLHNTLPELRSGWPSPEELSELFPEISVAAWEQVVPANPDGEYITRSEPSPCCQESKLERCMLTRHGLSRSQGWR